MQRLCSVMLSVILTAFGSTPSAGQRHERHDAAVAASAEVPFCSLLVSSSNHLAPNQVPVRCLALGGDGC